MIMRCGKGLPQNLKNTYASDIRRTVLAAIFYETLNNGSEEFMYDYYGIIN